MTHTTIRFVFVINKIFIEFQYFSILIAFFIGFYTFALSLNKLQSSIINQYVFAYNILYVKLNKLFQKTKKNYETSNNMKRHKMMSLN